MKYAKILCATLLLMLTAALSGCGSSSSTQEVKKVAVCFPNTSSSWESNGEAMRRALEEEGFEAALYYTKTGEEQLEQLKEAVAKNVSCIVICTLGVDNTYTDIFSEARRKNIHIITLDGFLKNDDVSYYTSFDNNAIGEAIGEYFEAVLNLPSGGGPYNIEFFAGGSGGENFFGGTMQVLEKYVRNGQLICRSGQTNFEQVTVKDWNPDNARPRINEILNKYYTDAPLHAVVSPNDDIAGAIIEELEKNGKPYPLISGLDGSPAAYERIKAGKQTFTIAKDPNILASKCVRMIKAVVEGTQPDINDMTSFSTGTKIVPAYLCTPMIIDQTNVNSMIAK